MQGSTFPITTNNIVAGSHFRGLCHYSADDDVIQPALTINHDVPQNNLVPSFPWLPTNPLTLISGATLGFNRSTGHLEAVITYEGLVRGELHQTMGRLPLLGCREEGKGYTGPRMKRLLQRQGLGPLQQPFVPQYPSCPPPYPGHCVPSSHCTGLSCPAAAPPPQLYSGTAYRPNGLLRPPQEAPPSPSLPPSRSVETPQVLPLVPNGNGALSQLEKALATPIADGPRAHQAKNAMQLLAQAADQHRRPPPGSLMPTIDLHKRDKKEERAARRIRTAKTGSRKTLGERWTIIPDPSLLPSALKALEKKEVPSPQLQSNVSPSSSSSSPPATMTSLNQNCGPSGLGREQTMETNVLEPLAAAQAPSLLPPPTPAAPPTPTAPADDRSSELGDLVIVEEMEDSSTY